MKSSVDKLSELNRRLNVQLPPEIVKGAFDEVFRDFQKQANLKGFRKGKAPLPLIKSMYMDRAKANVTENLLLQHFGEALKEHELNPVDSPEFEFEDPSELSGFSFSAVFDIRPEVILRNYQNLELQKEKLLVDDSRIEQILINIRNSHSTTEDIQEVRSAQIGDIALIDFEGSIEGTSIENGAGTNHPLELGSNQFIEGFEEGIVGMNPSETKILNLKFPETYPTEVLKGKNVDFKVTLNKLKKKVLPELNEKFLESIGAPGTVEDLKSRIREDIEQSEKKRIDNELKANLFKKLIELNPIEIPLSLLKKQKQMLIESFTKENTKKDVDPKEIQEYIDNSDDQFNKRAIEIIHISYLIDEISRKHDLTCQTEDFDHKIGEYVQITGLPESRIREYYSDPDLEDRLRFSIIEDKVLQFLLNSSKIIEIPKT